ncbi:MAG: RDD family protein [Gammaproteobacteria bacterium]
MNPTPDKPDHCRLGRRLLAILYDSCLLLATLLIATAALLPVTGGQAIASGNPLYSLYLLLLSYVYFIWQWHKGGQTLGMRAWRIRLGSETGGQAGWGTLSLRFCYALLSWLLLGGGFWCALADRQHRTLHDRLSGTHLHHTRSIASQ